MTWSAEHLCAVGIFAFDLNHIFPDSGPQKHHALFRSIPTPRTQNLPHKLSKFWTYCDKYKIMVGQATHNLESIKASAQFHAVGKIGFPQIPKSHFPSQASVVSLVSVIMASGSGTPG